MSSAWRTMRHEMGHDSGMRMDKHAWTRAWTHTSTCLRGYQMVNGHTMYYMSMDMYTCIGLLRRRAAHLLEVPLSFSLDYQKQ